MIIAYSKLGGREPFILVIEYASHFSLLSEKNY